jgi:nucleotide-binding universal stress UspA family protein
MSADDELPRAIRRILVALDASTESLGALEAAALIAARLRAELIGLFVEDINLLRLAGLPFAREIGLPSAHAREFNTEDIEQRLRAQAERAQRALARTAGAMQLRWSFHVTRGQVVNELLAAASGTDFVALGSAGHLNAPGTRLGGTARAFLSGDMRPVMVQPHGDGIRGPIAVLIDDREPAEAALTLAVDLAEDTRSELTVVIRSANAETATRLQHAAAQITGRVRIVRYRFIGAASKERTLEELRRLHPGTLILAADGGVAQELLRKIGCAVILV